MTSNILDIGQLLKGETPAEPRPFSEQPEGLKNENENI